jgi:LysM repeat protein
VKPGDTLSGIAAKYGIPDWHTIATLNGITDPQSIQPGQKIRVK